MSLLTLLFECHCLMTIIVKNMLSRPCVHYRDFLSWGPKLISCSFKFVFTEPRLFLKQPTCKRFQELEAVNEIS